METLQYQCSVAVDHYTSTASRRGGKISEGVAIAPTAGRQSPRRSLLLFMFLLLSLVLLLLSVLPLRPSVAMWSDSPLTTMTLKLRRQQKMIVSLQQKMIASRQQKMIASWQQKTHPLQQVLKSLPRGPQHLHRGLRVCAPSAPTCAPTTVRTDVARAAAVHGRTFLKMTVSATACAPETMDIDRAPARSRIKASLNLRTEQQREPDDWAENYIANVRSVASC